MSTRQLGHLRHQSLPLRNGSSFPGGSVGKESVCNAEDPGSIVGGEDPLEKEMALHSSVLAWRIRGTEGPGGLQSMGPQRVGQD